MADPAFFQVVSDRAPIRQGDIIRLDADTDPLPPTWGVVVTADCDIAQEKMGDYFTYLHIVPARRYLEHVWAAEELLKLGTQYAEKCVNLVYEADRKRNPQVRPMDAPELLGWIREDGADGVVDAIGITATKERAKAAALFETFALSDELTGNFLTPLERLTACWSRAGKHQNEQTGQIANAVNYRQMRSDYMFVPTLPNETAVGFVILLRDIRS
jgi:hypothetical protein